MSDDGCTCAEIAEVVGFRLSDDQIKALCDRLRLRVTSPAENDGGRSRCQHQHVKTFRSIPPHSKCLDCGARVEQRWVTPLPPAVGDDA